LEEGLGESDIGRVDALAQVVAELLADGAVQAHDEIFPGKAMVGAGLDGVVPEVIVDGEVDAGVQVEVVEGDNGLLVLRKGLQEGEKA